MSLNNQPSYVEVNEKEGTFTIAYIPSWYHEDRCDTCTRFRKAAPRTRSVVVKGTKTAVSAPVKSSTITFCECMEEEKPCAVTGKRYVGEENDIET